MSQAESISQFLARISNSEPIADVPLYIKKLADEAEALADKHANFAQQDSHILALALSSLTAQTCGGFMYLNAENGCSTLSHAFIMDGPHIIDIKGLRSSAQVRRDYKCHPTSANLIMSPERLCQLQEGSSVLTAELEARILAAIPVAREVLALVAKQVRVGELLAHMQRNR